MSDRLGRGADTGFNGTPSPSTSNFSRTPDKTTYFKTKEKQL
jgi:hypothetical protein